MSSTHLLVVLSVLLAVVVVAVLAGALIVVRQRLESISDGLAALAGALQGVESEHLRPLDGSGVATEVSGDRRGRRLPGWGCASLDRDARDLDGDECESGGRVRTTP